MSLFQLNGTRNIDFILEESSIKELRKRWRFHMANCVIEYPKKKFSGKGIVICGGGIQYFTCAWVAIEQIKSHNCTLPIELWYIGEELSRDCVLEMYKKGVLCKNLVDYNPDYIALKGVAIKPICILHSSFEEIFFIDADNICIENPEKLFFLKEYQNVGAVFWPDYWKTSLDNPIWDIMGIQYCDMPEQESGQLLINKRRCWDALNLCVYLNLNYKVYHEFLLGDKDTFRFSWLALNKDFYMIEKQPDVCGYIDNSGNFMGITMIQYNIDCETPLFLHRNLIKWDSTTINKKLWQKVKRFTCPIDQKKIYIGNSSENGHNFVDFLAGYEMFDFEYIFGNVEDFCLQYLIELRNENFYKSFLLVYENGI